MKIEIREQQKNKDSTNFSFPIFKMEKIAKNISNKIQNVYGQSIFKNIELLGIFNSFILFLISLKEIKNKKTDIEEKILKIADIIYFLKQKERIAVRIKIILKTIEIFKMIGKFIKNSLFKFTIKMPFLIRI